MGGMISKGVVGYRPKRVKHADKPKPKTKTTAKPTRSELQIAQELDTFEPAPQKTQSSVYTFPKKLAGIRTQEFNDGTTVREVLERASKTADC
jgi:hypothetical protein